MITCRRKSGEGYLDLDLFSVDSIPHYIDWDNIRSDIDGLIYHYVRMGDNSIHNNDTKTYTTEELLGLVSLPLFNLEGKTIKLDSDDVVHGNVVSSIRKFYIKCKNSKEIVMRDITISDDYTLPFPGYRIITGYDSLDRFIISVIHDSSSPNTEQDFTRFCGEIAEIVIQYNIKLLGANNIYYYPSDYSIFEDCTSNYRSTGLIVMTDFMSYKNLLFIAEYIHTMIDSAIKGLKEIPDSTLSVPELIEGLFEIDYKDNCLWVLNNEELLDFYDNYYEKNISYTKWVEKTINDVYFQN